MASTSSSPFELPPRDSWTRSTVILSTFSHAAVWAGLYVIAGVVCVAQISGIDELVHPRLKIASGAFAFCTAMAVYLLDRVKLRNTWLDPADALAHPRRYAFVATHATEVRGLMVALLITATWLGSRVLEWGTLLPLLAVAGVLVYAGRPRALRPRPKDILLLKNAYVAFGIAGFAALVALAAVSPHADITRMKELAESHAIPVVIASAYLVLRVLADAVLCDLDDEEADRHFGTKTLPIHLGRMRAWNIAVCVRILSAIALALIPQLPLFPRLAWSAVTIVSSIALRVAAPSRVRDWVDARFAIEAGIVTLLLILLRMK